jgi:hypothetical protein
LARRYEIVRGLPELNARLKAAGRVGDIPLMRGIGEEYAATVRDFYDSYSHPYAEGDLRDSIGVRDVQTRAVTVGAGGTVKPAARAIEYGTAERRVSPRRAARLAFFWQKESRYFVGRPGQTVRHPAVAAQPFFGPAFEEPHARLFVVRLRDALVDLWNSGA